MNPKTNKFEELLPAGTLKELTARLGTPYLFRPNGEPVPPHWSIFQQGELVDLKGYTFKVAHIGESYMVLEPINIPVIDLGEEE